MANDILKVAYKDSVTPAATKFLSSKPLALEFEGEIELEGSDKAIADTVKKEFEKQMSSQIDGQLKHLNEWLKEKNEIVADMVGRYEVLEKMKFPSDPKEAKKYEKEIKDMADISKKMNDFQKDYEKIVTDWAGNVAKQQGLIAMKLALQKARVTVQSDKALRIRLGQVAKVVLVIAGIALSIAAVVITAGAAAPVIVGLAATGAAIGGISSLVALGKNLADNADLEKRLLANVKKDVESLSAALKPIANVKSSLGKYVTELQNLMKIREDTIRKLQSDLQKNKVLATSYAADLAAVTKLPAIDAGEVAKRTKAVESVTKQITDMEKQIAKLEADNKEGKALLDELDGLGADLEKISTQAPNSLLGNLKKCVTTLDGLTNLGNSIGGLVGAASGV